MVDLHCWDPEASTVIIGALSQPATIAQHPIKSKGNCCAPLQGPRGPHGGKRGGGVVIEN